MSESTLILREITTPALNKLMPRSFKARKSFFKTKFRRRVSLGLLFTIALSLFMLTGSPVASTTSVKSNALFGDLFCFYDHYNAQEVKVSPDAWPGAIGTLGSVTGAVVPLANKAITNTPSVAGSVINSFGKQASVSDLFSQYNTPYAGTPDGKVPAKAVTAYEWFGTAGQQWGVEQYKELNASCPPFMTISGNFIASILFSIDQTVAEIGLTVFGWSMNIDAFSPFLDSIGKVLNSLKESLYLPYLIPMIFLGALYMGYVGLVKKRSSQAIQAATWMLLSSIFGITFLTGSNPTMFSSYINNTVKTVTTYIVGSMADATSGQNGLCSLPETTEGVFDNKGAPVLGADGKQKMVTTSAPGAGWRIPQCSIWEIFVFKPWANGALGDSANNLVDTSKTNNDIQYLKPTDPEKKAVNSNEVGIGANGGVTWPGHKNPETTLALVYLDSRTYNHDLAILGNTSGTGNGLNADTVNSITTYKQKELYSVLDTVKNDYPAQLNNVNGRAWFHRVTIALVDFLAMLFGSIPLLMLSFGLIILEVSFVFILLVAPLFLLLGVHPGFGRRFAMSWVEMLIGNFLKRIGTGFLIGVFLTVLGAIISSDANWIMEVVLIAATSIGIMQQRKRILDQLGSAVQLGGRHGLGNPNAIASTAKNYANRSGEMIALGRGTRKGGGSFVKGIAGGLLAENAVKDVSKGLKDVHNRAQAKQEVKAERQADQGLAPIKAVVNQKKEASKATAQQKLRQLADFDLMENSPKNQEAMDQWVEHGRQNNTAIPRPSDPKLASYLESKGATLYDRPVLNREEAEAIGDPIKGATDSNNESTSDSSSRRRRPVRVDPSQDSNQSVAPRPVVERVIVKERDENTDNEPQEIKVEIGGFEPLSDEGLKELAQKILEVARTPYSASSPDPIIDQEHLAREREIDRYAYEAYSMPSDRVNVPSHLINPDTNNPFSETEWQTSVYAREQRDIDSTPIDRMNEWVHLSQENNVSIPMPRDQEKITYLQERNIEMYNSQDQIMEILRNPINGSGSQSTGPVRPIIVISPDNNTGNNSGPTRPTSRE
jgi:hypothetical protein